jgi:hypothetical protein
MLIGVNRGMADSKVAAFKEAGILLADLTMDIPALVKQALGK